MIIPLSFRDLCNAEKYLAIYFIAAIILMITMRPDNLLASL
ncbi:hypothetical protein PC1_1473 [Pectobacterium carotovorum subsp. carotovorum PC1]|uniref:Uncharacterized protein n=1 Tax=Pectobacterium carotovorum subsp. carotovorum (strain PC1) TaxID=561230 RepID=C6DDQ6_PECCP|nr:hypothetical protein PC1_1473 [Pectobacterium carotovorum subsp. carotovorum PC1]